MPFWRREEPAHQKLAREGGLSKPRERPEARRHWHDALVGIHGVARPREWEAVATVEVTGLVAERVAFVTLPDGTIIVEEGPDGNLEPFAEAVEGSIRPPYRAEAVPQDNRRWAVAANPIEVLELPGVAEWADEITLAVREDARELLVDGMVKDGTVPALEAHAGARYPSFAARARRLDGDLWEVEISAL